MPGRPRSKKHPQEPAFSSPPVWIHAALAAKCFLGKEIPLLISRRREAKRRALLQMLDRLPIRSDARSIGSCVSFAHGDLRHRSRHVH